MVNKVFTLIRTLIFPFKKLEKILPKTGKFLDIGCGHGTLAYILAIKSRKRQITAVDPDKRKIREAIRLHSQPNITYKAVKFERIKSKFDVITIVDVLYLLPTNEKINFLKNASSKLVKNGKIIIVETPTDSLITNIFLNTQELLMTKIFKVTFTKQKKVYLTKTAAYRNIIIKSNLILRKERVIWGILPYKHVIFELANG